MNRPNAVIKNYLQKLLGNSQVVCDNFRALISQSDRTPREMETVIWALEQRVMMDAAPFDVELAVDHMEVDLDHLDTTSTDLGESNLPSQSVNDLDAALIESFSEIASDLNDFLVANPTESTLQLVVVDQSVEDYQTLIDSLVQDAEPGVLYDFVFIEPGQSGLEAINQRLSSSQFDAVHLISHGSDGQISLGSDQLNLSSLNQFEQQLDVWKTALTEDADVFVYGCNLASTSDGEAFIEAFANATGADVAASDDLTGHHSLDGDWDLEYKSGDIEQNQLFSEHLPDTWEHVLEINTVGNDGDTTDSVAVTPNGDKIFVVTNDADDGDGNGVFVILQSADGSVTSPQIPVNQFTTGNQQWASVDADAQGNFAVTWTSEDQVNGQDQVYVRLFDADGNALTNEILVSDTTDSAFFGRESTIAMNSSGEFVVVWEGEGPGDTFGVFVQRFNADGSTNGSMFLADTTASGTQFDPSVSMNDNGEFVVVWAELGKISFQTFDSDGSRISAVEDWFINFTGHEQPSVSMNSSGNFAISMTYGTSDTGVRAKVFDIDGNALTGNVVVNAGGGDGQQYNSDILLGDDGGFTVVYEGEGTEDVDGIYARSFASDGTPLTAITLINPVSAGSQVAPSIDGNSSTQFVIAYSGDGPGGEGLYGATSWTNQAPTATGSTLSVTEGLAVPISESSLGYSDPDGNLLEKITIESLPTKGSLLLNGSAVSIGQEITIVDIQAGNLTYEPGAGEFGNAFASFDFRVNDGGDDAASVATMSFDVDPQDVLWFSTKDNITNGPSELTSWTTGDVIQAGGTDLELGATTDGDLSKQFSLEPFASGSEIDALHHVNSTVTIGKTNPITLNAGDILFSVDADTSLPGLGTVRENDIIAFHPTSADYSTGTFSLVLDGSNVTQLTGIIPNSDDTPAATIGFEVEDFWSLTLVEKDTMVGDTLLKEGNFLFSQKGAEQDNDIYWMSIDDPSSNTVVISELVEGDEINITKKIDGIELIERNTTMGHTTVNGGTILVTIDAEESVGSNSLNVKDEDVFALNVTATTLGSGTATATASTFFTGLDAGLPDDGDADLKSIAHVGEHDPNIAPVIADQLFSVDENAANGTVVGQVVASDSPGEIFTFGIVGGSGMSTFDIDPDTGDITVTDVSQLDFETNPSFTLTVEVTDLDGLTNSATITVNLNDLASISGAVFEDTDGDSDYLEESIAVDGVTVHLYEDTNGNNTLDNGDVLVDTVTSSGGQFRFDDAGDGNYFVVVDSKSIASSQSLLGSQSDVWAQQTYGSEGSLVNRNSVESQMATDGALYGGRHIGISDDLSDLTNAQHVTAVDVSGSDVANIDSAFSFNVVTNVLGGDSQDDDAGNRTVQGSLRQFIQNANALDGDNAMRFVPLEGTNMNDGSDQWWRVVVTEALPQLTDEGTTIDGRAYDANSPTQLLDPNSGSIGSSGNVGTSSTTLNQVERPELEIVNDRNSQAVDNGIHIQASSTTIQHVGIHGFGTTSEGGNIKVDGFSGGELSDITIRDNIIGSHIGSVVDPALLASDPLGPIQNGANNIAIDYTDDSVGSNILQNNIIAFAERAGVDLLQSSNWLISDNEILDNAKTHDTLGGIDVRQMSSDVTISGNLISGNRGAGIDFDQSTGQLTVENNTIDNNGTGSVETTGIRVFGDDNAIRHNVISNHAGPGVLVTGQGSSAGVASTGNQISQNEFSGNGGVSIDLIESGSSSNQNQAGDGHSPNDGFNEANAGNQGLDYPVITSANFDGSSTLISGTAAPNSSVEIYLATGDGVGTSHLVTTSTDGSGNFAVSVTTLNASQAISAIVIDSATGNTSEFGQAVNVNTIPQANGGTIAGLQAGTITLKVSDFDFSDADGDELVQIQITAVPDKGELRLNDSIVLSVGSTFTKAQLDNGDITFVPDGLDIGSPYTSFQFVASDGKANTSTGQIDVNIISAIPVFTSPTTFTLPENQAAVGTVNAVDPQSDVTYSLGTTGDSSLFQIDALTGALSFISPPDFENPGDGVPVDNVYDVQVFATDAASNAVSQDIQVTVTNVNEAPDAVDQNFSIDENVADGTTVGTVASSDQDAGQNHTYQVVGGTGATAFSIDSSTGNITVTDSSQLDFESSTSFTLQVDVTDDGTPPLTTSIEVTIDINNVNEAPDDSPQQFSLAENPAVGSDVGFVQAIDQDVGQSHTFTIIGGAHQSAFSIDPNTGLLKVVDPSALDFETNPTIQLIVLVTDDHTSPLSATIPVEIQLTNINEIPFDIVADNSSVLENAQNGDTVGNFTTLDHDNSDTHTYTLLNDADGRFAINPNTGELTVANANKLDFETDEFHSIVVETKDAGGLTHSETVTISVQNVDEAPKVVVDRYTLNEGDSTTISIADLLSNDTDPEGDAISFVKITKLPNHGFVTTDTSGDLVYQHNGSEAFSDTIRYQITANGLTDTGRIQITVNPMNDQPLAVNDNIAVAHSNSIVIDREDLLANDIDPDSPNLSIHVVSGPSNGRVSINAEGDVVFTPNDSVTQNESFSYVISDGSLTSNVAQVNLSVVGIVPNNTEQPLEETDPGDTPITPGEGDLDPPPANTTTSTENEDDEDEDFGLASILNSNIPKNEELLTTLSTQKPAEDRLSNSSYLLSSSVDRNLKPTQSLLDEVITQSDSLRNVVGRSISDLETVAFASLFDQFDGTRNQIVDSENLDVETVAIVASVGGILTVGYVMWLTQSGFLMTGLISSIPSWQLLDPLRILEQSNVKDDSVEDMVNSDV